MGVLLGCNNTDQAKGYEAQVKRTQTQETTRWGTPISLDSSMIIRLERILPLFDTLPENVTFSHDLELYPDASQQDREWQRAEAVDSLLRLRLDVQGRVSCENDPAPSLRDGNPLCHTRLWQMRQNGDLYLMTFVVPETAADIFPTLRLCVVNRSGWHLGSIEVSSASGDAGFSSHTRARLSGRQLFVETENSYDRSVNDLPEGAPIDSTITYKIERRWFLITDSEITLQRTSRVDSSTVLPFYRVNLEAETRRKRLEREAKEPIKDAELDKLLNQ